MSVDKFTFQISLTVLDHLGRNLYRSPSTVLGEAISNAWDADATLVDIELNQATSTLVVRDNGVGMTAQEFQDRFLKVGFTKRSGGVTKSLKKRPFIGRKGIGKLALLSCAESVTVATRVQGEAVIGGTIVNTELDTAIVSNLSPDDYVLQELNPVDHEPYSEGLDQGTVIVLRGFKGGIRTSVGQFRKLLALYFRFSLVDPEFQISLNGHKITEDDLADLADATEFVWKTDQFKDPYVENALTKILERGRLKMPSEVTGFIASVRKPRDLSIVNADERVSVDLFVNGRIRERNILRHIPTARVAESYLYGQIHVDSLEGDVDRFTTSREGVVAGDEVFEQFLRALSKAVRQVIDDWDNFRRKHREAGDPENESIPARTRKSEELVNIVAEDFSPSSLDKSTDVVAAWLSDLHDDASFNVSSYTECFIAENLIRNLIRYKKTALPNSVVAIATDLRKREAVSKAMANVSIEIRVTPDDLSYLSMDHLANFVDKPKDPLKELSLARDAKSYKPVRDACAHTGRLTPEGKAHLSSVYANIKARLRELL